MVNDLKLETKPEAWLCIDNIAKGYRESSANVELVKARAKHMFNGEHAWTITPLYFSKED